jgi:hypothetical protein
LGARAGLIFSRPRPAPAAIETGRPLLPLAWALRFQMNPRQAVPDLENG